MCECAEAEAEAEADGSVSAGCAFKQTSPKATNLIKAAARVLVDGKRNCLFVLSGRTEQNTRAASCDGRGEGEGEREHESESGLMKLCRCGTIRLTYDGRSERRPNAFGQQVVEIYVLHAKASLMHCRYTVPSKHCCQIAPTQSALHFPYCTAQCTLLGLA